MEKRERQVEVSAGMKVCRVIGVLLVLAAIAYVIWPGDFDEKGLIGYVDDFMVFMAASHLPTEVFRSLSDVTSAASSTCYHRCSHYWHCAGFSWSHS